MAERKEAGMSETRIVINACHGGFSLSDAGAKRYAELKGLTLYPEQHRFGFTVYWTCPPDKRPKWLEGEAFYEASMEDRAASNAAYRANTLDVRAIPRDDPDLVRVVEELGEASDGRGASLKVVEVPAGVSWHIDEYDGSETIREDHRTWA